MFKVNLEDKEMLATKDMSQVLSEEGYRGSKCL